MTLPRSSSQYLIAVGCPRSCPAIAKGDQKGTRTPSSAIRTTPFERFVTDADRRLVRGFTGRVRCDEAFSLELLLLATIR